MVLEQARKRFDVILVDTGPVPGSIESSVAASQVDGVVLCVSRGQQGRWCVARASICWTSERVHWALCLIGRRRKISAHRRIDVESEHSSACTGPCGTDMAQFGPVRRQLRQPEARNLRSPEDDDDGD